jgi:peroxiredoxin
MQENTTDKILKPGVMAPDFELGSAPRTKLKLSNFRGKPVILAFYPADFSPVCGDQIALYNEVLADFDEYGAAIVGISVDGVWCHAAFAKQNNIHFTLLSDFEPKGEISRQYGAYRDSDGTSERALFLIDKDGMIYWSYLSPVDINPGADGILDALDSLRARDARIANTKEAPRPDARSDTDARA